MESIPTAKEFWDSACKTDELKSPGDIMTEFARLHVEAALKAAAENVKTRTEEKLKWLVIIGVEDKQSILNSYPLTHIK